MIAAVVNKRELPVYHLYMYDASVQAPLKEEILMHPPLTMYGEPSEINDRAARPFRSLSSMSHLLERAHFFCEALLATNKLAFHQSTS